MADQPPHPGTTPQPDTAVSRRNPGPPAKKFNFPILKDDPFIQVWNGGLSDTVMQMVRKREDWTGVHVMRRSYVPSDEDTHIEVIIELGEARGFEELRQEVKEACLLAGRPDVEIDIYQRAISRW